MEFKKPKKFKTPTEEEDWSYFLNRLWEMSQQISRILPNIDHYIDPYIPPATPERGLLEIPDTIQNENLLDLDNTNPINGLPFNEIPNENFRIYPYLPPELENIFEQPLTPFNLNITINQDGTISIQDDQQ